MLTILKQWLTAPVFAGDEDKTRIAGHVYFIFKMWLVPAIIFGLIIPLVTGNFSDRSLAMLSTGVLFIVQMALVKKGFVRTAVLLLVSLAWLLINYTTLRTGGVRAVGFGGNLLIVLVAGMLVNLNTALLFSLLSILLGLGLAIAQTQGVLPPIATEVNAYTAWITQGVFLLLITGFLYLTLNDLQQSLARTRRAEARLRGVVESSPDFILEIDRTGTILLANRHAERYEGTQVHQFVPPEYLELIDKSIVQSFETGQNIAVELRAYEMDGSLRWNSVRVGPVLSGGQVASLVVIITNIHAQKEAAVQARQRSEQLATIVEIGHAVSTLQDLEGVLEIIYQQIQRIAPVDAFFIALLAAEKNQLFFPLTYDEGLRYYETDGQLRPESLLAQVIQSGEPRRVHRTEVEVIAAQKDGNWVGNTKRKSGSLLYVPLWQADQVIGVLSIQSYALNAYPDEMVETVAGIGDQVAIAIQNSRLFTNMQQELVVRRQAEQKAAQTANQLTMLNEIGRAVSEVTNLDTVLEIIRQQLEKLVDFDFYSVRVFDENQRTVTYLAVYESGRYWEEADAPLIPGTHSYKVFETGNSILHLLTSEEIEQYKRSPYQHVGDRSHMTTSLIFVPLKKQGKTIGALSVQRHEQNAYTHEHLKLVEAVAIQVGIAIENARLFTNLQLELAERRQAEAEIHRLNSELEKRVEERTAELTAANKELEAFSYSVSHDLRAPLRAVSGFAKILSNDFSAEFSPPARSFLAKIMASSTRMHQLIDDLLAFSRLGRKAIAFQEVDLNALVQSVMESLAPATAGHQIEWILAELPPAVGDPALLQQVYANLIGNAVKYSRKRDLARIEIGRLPQPSLPSPDGRPPKGDGGAGGEGPVYFVRDNGAGFDMQYAGKLFGVFQRLHRDDEFEGTGIGLATVQRIVQRHGGRIWAEAEPGKGATFYFTLGQPE